MGAGGGGMSPGAGSLNGTIFELVPEAAAPEPEADAILLARPACLSVDPTSFFTSGTFSLILVLRVPRSLHSFVSCAACASAPVGSTNIWMRAFDEEGGMPGVDREEPTVVRDEDARDEDAGTDDAVVARAFRGR